MEDEFEELKSQNSFDIKALAFRALNYWYLFVITIGIALVATYFYNKRLERIYSVESLISIKEEQNPFFSASMNLTFNWGGASDKVETIKTTLKSRAHNENVVRVLQSYIHYKDQGEYRLEDIHTNAPFIASLDENFYQIINTPIKIVFSSADQYTASIDFTNAENFVGLNYKLNKTANISPSGETFSKNFVLNEEATTNYFKFALTPRSNTQIEIGKEYYIYLTSLNSEIAKYRSIGVNLKVRGASMLVLSLQGPNRAILADYLNVTSEILREKQLEEKNQFATNTLNFIDKMIIGVEDSLRKDEQKLKKYKQDNKVFDPSLKGEEVFTKLNQYSIEKNGYMLKLEYYKLLEDYLRNSTDFRALPAPASSGIDDPNIVNNVSKIVALSIRRAKLSETVKSEIFFKEIDQDIDATKRVLLENVKTARSSTAIDISNVQNRIARANAEFRKLPEEEQQLFNIERSYKISEASYTMLLEKKNEAGIVKAANVSDVKVIDSAKDLGQAPILPNTRRNYTIALFIGLLLPLGFVFLVTLLDNNISTPEDIKNLSKIPILGIVSKNKLKSDLVVFESPKSAIAESFRGIRSSLQYIYKNLDKEKTKTVMITSSVSGEGKTFCSINIASVFSLTGKKTILVGLDLRKPKIFGDFGISNEIGVVNYLIGQKNLDEVIQTTNYENLDIITSGPVPPNPSELLISEQLDEFIAELKTRYDYIILDTPPLGLVSDALDLIHHTDATIYMVRQDYSKKAMLNVINDKYKKGEVKNISFVFNAYRQKNKYGYGYGYGYGYSYGYGYGNYGNGYHEDENTSMLSRFKNLFRKNKN
ncbi:exopolysaccharide transport family protein [Kordia jejudonensis]|uniref:exopolysaccharide transport family protein n=1 Tax=Kordia jejudonensis TaxID=1348245 RepID=UPI0006294286|nr:tyrosine-protein kinase [Kordia jejudonensis]